jgi:hypothetical protein
MTPWIDGLLEGHESPGFRNLYRLWMVCYIIFSVFAGLCNIGLIMHDGAQPGFALVSLMNLGMLFFSLFLVKSYKADGLDPKFKRATGVLMLFVTVLGIGCVMIFSETLNYKKDTEHPSAGPPGPTPTPTPSSNHTNTSAPAGFDEWRLHQLRMQKLERENQQRLGFGKPTTGDFKDRKLKIAKKHRFSSVGANANRKAQH